MTAVFIAGSISISRIHPFVIQRIETIIDSGFDIMVGDANGVDSSIQQILFDRKVSNVTVYCSGERPRNNIGNWKVNKVFPDAAPNSRAYFTAKDVEMAKNSDYGFMIWDAKSTGTLSNIFELLSNERKSIVFINKAKEFIKVEDAESMQKLIDYMSQTAKSKADEKIDLSSKLYDLSNTQLALSM